MSKAMLLPLSSDSVRELSLAHHLALWACLGNAGNSNLLHEVFRVVYLTYFLQEAGFGNADLDLYRRAEASLLRSLRRAERERVWRIDGQDATVFEEIVRLSDQQLSTAAMRFIVNARERLERFIRGEDRSPFLVIPS